MSRHSRCLWAGLVLVLAASAGVAADAATDLLVSQARYWEAKGRLDLAREAWQKLLRLDPHHPEALARVSPEQAGGDRSEPAKRAPQGKRPPDSSSLGNSRGDDRRGSSAAPGASPEASVGRAKSVAVNGSAAQQLATLSVPRADPYLQESQGLVEPEGSWEATRRRLEQRIQESPHQLDDRIALAHHLALRKDTRFQGLEQLMELAGNPEAGVEVQAIWRQTLLRMSGRGAGVRFFEAYLAQYGEDADVREKLQAARATGETRREVHPAQNPQLAEELRRAWAWLDAGNLEAAEEVFVGLRARDPFDVEAAGGLGSVRLRQERYAEARELLEEAARGDPQRWNLALSNALIGEEMRLAAAESVSGQLAEAESRLRQLISSSPQIAGQDAGVNTALADVLVAQQKFDAAEVLYREVLRKQRDHEGASRGMIHLLANTDRVGDAMGFYRTLNPKLQASIGGLPSLQALALRQQAARALSLKDAGRAESLLREALVIDPVGVRPRLDLARLYLSQNRRREARSLIDGLPQDGAFVGEASYVRALIAADEQNWYDGLVWMEKVPAAQRNAEMTTEQRRLWVLYQAERAAVHARQGHRARALSLLGEIESYARTPELLGRVATAYSEAGDAQRALYLLRQEIARKPDPAVDLQIRYADLLLSLDQQVEFEAQLDRLARRSNLTAAQQDALSELRIAHRLQRAERQSAAGDATGAREGLESMLREHPLHLRLMVAVARLYEDAREPEQAISLYRQALDRDPGLLAAYQGLVRVSLARGNADAAGRWLAEAMRIEPDSSELLALSAQLATARGQHSRARDLAQRALELKPASAGSTSVQTALRLPLLDPQLRPLGTLADASSPAASEVEQARFERQLRNNPFDPAALSNLAALAAAQARYEEAQDLLERAQRLAPESAEIRTNLERLAQWQRSAPAPSSAGRSISKLPPEPPRLWNGVPPTS